MSLNQKLWKLQQTVSVSRDKDVSYSTSKGRMSYSYTTLEEFWNCVQEFFNVNKLRVQWHQSVNSTDMDVALLHCRIVDVENDEYIESVVPVRFSHSDFRADGARYSYWCRMVAIRLCGLITNEDQEAETFGTKMEQADKPKPEPTNGKKSAPANIIY